MDRTCRLRTGRSIGARERANDSGRGSDCCRPHVAWTIPGPGPRRRRFLPLKKWRRCSPPRGPGLSWTLGDQRPAGRDGSLHACRGGSAGNGGGGHHSTGGWLPWCPRRNLNPHRIALTSRSSSPEPSTPKHRMTYCLVKALTPSMQFASERPKPRLAQVMFSRALPAGVVRRGWLRQRLEDAARGATRYRRRGERGQPIRSL